MLINKSSLNFFEATRQHMAGLISFVLDHVVLILNFYNAVFIFTDKPTPCYLCFNISELRLTSFSTSAHF